MQLQSLDTKRLVDVSPEPIIIGRVPQLQITSPNVSRKHAVVFLSEDGKSLSLKANKKVFLLRNGVASPVVLEPSSEFCQLAPGDSFFLESMPGGALASGFQVTAAQSSTSEGPQAVEHVQPVASGLSGARGGSHAEPAGHANEEPNVTPGSQKSRRLVQTTLRFSPTVKLSPDGIRQDTTDADANSPMRKLRHAHDMAHDSALETAGLTPTKRHLPPQLSLRSEQARTAAAKRRAPQETKQQDDRPHQPGQAKSPAAASVAMSAETASPKTHGPLEGVRVCFWMKSHMRTLAALVRKAGTAEDTVAGPCTTHIVLGHDMLTAEAAMDRLNQERQKARAAQKLSAHHARAGLGSSPVGRAASRGEQAGAAARSLGEVHFVTPEYFSACLAQERRLPEQQYATRLKRSAQSLGAKRSASPEAAAAAQPAAAAAAAVEADPASLAASPASSADSPAGSFSAGSVTQLQPGPGPASATSRLCTQPDSATQTPAPAAAVGTQAAAAAAAPAGVHDLDAADWPVPTDCVVPDASQICATPEDWGRDDKWIEPWDDRLACITLKKLFRTWQPTKKARAAEHRSDHEDGESTDGESAGQGRDQGTSTGTGSQGAEASQAGQQVRVCNHRVCSAQPYCFIAELERIRKNYVEGNLDQYRRKAISKAISIMEGVSQPIRTADDVDRILWQVGPRTREKVQEIIEGQGTYWRNTVWEADERLQALAAFTNVWGAGTATAANWYNRGCRSLQDVAALPDLTAMQRIGIKYYDDFQARIPRPEVAESERLVKQGFIRVLHQATDVSEEAVSQRLHVRAAGSYLRGRPDCSDIDYLITPSPAAMEAAEKNPEIAPLLEPHALTQALVDYLMDKGWVTDDVLRIEKGSHFKSKDNIRTGISGGATYMGVWKGPRSPCYRRIDIKMYPLATQACAVTYFCSATAFNRALRHYGKVADPKEMAASGGMGCNLRLTDHDLVPISTVGGVTRIVGPPVPVKNETEIFRAMGLHYVPPHMRETKW